MSECRGEGVGILAGFALFLILVGVWGNEEKLKNIEQSLIGEEAMNDTQRLDWLESRPGYNLLNDDGGRWAVSTSGIQPVPQEEPIAMEMVHFIEKEEWQSSIREAIDFAMQAEE